MFKMTDNTKKYAIQRAKELTSNLKLDGEAELNREDIQEIAYVMYVLYQEPTMNADDMRDLAQILDHVLRHMTWYLER